MLKKVIQFYRHAFIQLWQFKVSRQLWIIILIKLFIMFLVLKLFFFKDFLNSRFENKEEKSEYIIEQLTK